jgi:asparagine synthase (glutamine-hydrolysing)
MCGILGYIGNKTNNNNKSACKLLKHRGPDDDGRYFDYLDKKNNIIVDFIHTRLSIFDLSSNGNQPMYDEEGRVIIYNGEIFNWKSLKLELQSKGHKFRSETDTEVILKGYVEWGNNIFRKLNGFWALAIFDPKKNHIIICRDRLGVKPLYYYYDDSCFCFSSEIKPLSAYLQHDLSVDYEYVAEFSLNGFINVDGKTIYKNINEFPVSSYFKIKDNKIEKEIYWKHTRNVITESEDEIQDKFNYLIESAVDNWMQADVPVALTLSSGIDSSVVACATKELGYSNVEAFTSHFKNSNINEYEKAGKLANDLGIKHNKIETDLDEIKRELNKFSYHQELLYTSYSQFISWLVIKKIAVSKYKAYISGQGADELFLGYKRYLIPYILQQSNICNILKSICDVNKNSNLNIIELLGQLLYFGGSGIRKRRAEKRGNKLFKEKYLKHALGVSTKKVNVSLVQLQRDELLGTAQLRRLLRYDDRSSSAFGLEARPVFLDYNLVEFALNLPPNLLIKNGWSKYLLRKYLDMKGYGYVAWNREKLGFPAPDYEWSKIYFEEKILSGDSKLYKNNLDIDRLDKWGTVTASIIDSTSSQMGWK